MANNRCLNNIKPVGIIAAISSAVQGVVGIALSLCAILTYFCIINAGGTTPDFGYYIINYFQGDKCKQSEVFCPAIRDGTTSLMIWMFLSIFFNSCLFIVSTIMFLELWKWKKEKVLFIVNVWIAVSVLTAINDVLVTYRIGADYVQSLSCMRDSIASVTLAISLYFAARGIFLWFANTAFIIFLLYAAKALYKKIRNKERTQQDIVRNWPSYVRDDSFRPATPPTITRQFPKPIDNNREFIDNRREATRIPSMYGNQWPEHTAMARWPSLAFAPTPQSLRENSIRRPPLPPDEARARTMREYAVAQRLPPPVIKENLRRNRSSPDGGVDNLAYLRTENNVTYLRLTSDNESEVYDAELPPFPPPQPPPPQPKLVRNRSSLYNDYPEDMPKLSSRTEAKIDANMSRPHSLHEAIINRPPLRHVPRQRKESSSNV